MEKVEEVQIIKNNEVDLVALLKVIRLGKKTIYYCIGVSLIIGVFIGLLSPIKYSVTATLLPSSEKKANSMGGLSALAGMAGVNLSAMTGQSNTIPSEIYPQIVKSYPFLRELIHEDFNFIKYEEPITLFEYVRRDTVETLGRKIAKYTIRLPWTIKDSFTKKDGSLHLPDYGVLNLKENEIKALKKVSELIQVAVDDKTGLVALSVESKEPVLTAQYVQKSLELLQQYVIDYQTKQAQEKLRFVLESYSEKKSEYEYLQKKFFEYKDMHRNIISERTNPEFQRLSDEYELASSVYNELAKQLEQAKIALKEETPAFSIIEPAKVPVERSAPKRMIILLVSCFVGCFIGVSSVLAKMVWRNLIAEINESL